MSGPDPSSVLVLLERKVEDWRTQSVDLHEEAEFQAVAPLREFFDDQLINAEALVYTRLSERLVELLEQLAGQAQGESDDKKAAAAAVWQLLTMQFAFDDNAKFQKLAGVLDLVLDTAVEPRIVLLAARVYGELWSKAGRAYASNVEEKINEYVAEIKLDDAQCTDLKRLKLLYLLTEAAKNLPSTFLRVLNDFHNHIFVPLLHRNIAIRNAAADALQVALEINVTRNTRSHMKEWKQLLHNVANILKWDSLGSQLPIHELHGALLATQKLNIAHRVLQRLRLPGDILPLINRYKDHRDKDIRNAVLGLIDTSVKHCKTAYTTWNTVSPTLGQWLDYLVAQLAPKWASDKVLIFNTLATIADTISPKQQIMAAQRDLSLRILTAFKDHLLAALSGGGAASTTPRGPRRPAAPENVASTHAAVECIGSLSLLVRHTHPINQARAIAIIRQLMEPLLPLGLCQPVVDTLQKIKNIPELENPALQMLLDLSSHALCGRPYPNSHVMTGCHPLPLNLVRPVHTEEGRLAEQASVLALRTLTSELSALRDTRLGLLSVEFLRDVLQPRLVLPSHAIYRAAVGAVIRVSSALMQRFRMPGLTGDVHLGNVNGHTEAMLIIDRGIYDVLRAATTHLDRECRAEALRQVSRCAYVMERLRAPEPADYLITLLRDDAEPLRVVMLLHRIHGSIAVSVPAALIQHLKDLLYNGPLTDPTFPVFTRIREAKSLQALVFGAFQQCRGYELIILQTLQDQIKMVADLHDKYRKAMQSQSHEGDPFHGPRGVAGSEHLLMALLSCLGVLAECMGHNFEPHAKAALHVVFPHVEGPGRVHRRTIAMRVIGQIVAASGDSMQLYLDNDRLLNQMLRLMHDENPAVREVAARTLGIIGALDPWSQRRLQAVIAGEGRLEKEGVRPIEQKTQPVQTFMGTLTGNHLAAEEQAEELIPLDSLATSSEEYYPSLSINSLMRVLRDRALTSHHANAVKAVTCILYNLGSHGVQYIEKVMPALLGLLRQNKSPAFREMMLRELQPLVLSLREFLRRYLDDIFAVIYELWHCHASFPRQALELLAATATVMRAPMAPLLREQELVSRFIELINLGDLDSVWPLLRLLEQMDVHGDPVTKMIWPRLLVLFHSLWCSDADRIRMLRSMQVFLAHIVVDPIAFYTGAVFTELRSIMFSYPTPIAHAALDAICVCGIQIYAFWKNSLLQIDHLYRMRTSLPANALPPHEWYERVRAKTLTAVHPALSTDSDWEHANPGWGYECELVTRLRRLHAHRPEYQPVQAERLEVDTAEIVRVVDTTDQCSNKEDWHNWLRTLSLALIGQSPSPPLRACLDVAKNHPPMARDLFAVAFQSCWPHLPTTEAKDGARDRMVSSYIEALVNPTTPVEIKTVLLALEEFMQLDEKDMGLLKPFLTRLAKACGNFAKALHHEEAEFEELVASYEANPHDKLVRKTLIRKVEQLVLLNRACGQTGGAQGVVDWVERRWGRERDKEALRALARSPKIQWYLNRWQPALEGVQRELDVDQHKEPASRMDDAARLDRMRAIVNCRHGLMDYEATAREASALIPDSAYTPNTDDEDQLLSHQEVIKNYHVAELKAMSEWYLGSPGMDRTVKLLRHTPSYLAPLLEAVKPAREGDVKAVKRLTMEARMKLVQQVVAPLGESYERAYPFMVNVQVLQELNELATIMSIRKTQPEGWQDQQQLILRMWQQRLVGVQDNPIVWQPLLTVHKEVLPPNEDETNWISFAKLCRTSGRIEHAKRVLSRMLEPINPLTATQPSDPGYGAGTGRPAVMLALLDTLWQDARPAQRVTLIPRLQQLVEEVVGMEEHRTPTTVLMKEATHSSGWFSTTRPISFNTRQRPPLAARASLTLGRWHWKMLQEGPPPVAASNPATPTSAAANPFAAPGAAPVEPSSPTSTALTAGHELSPHYHECLHAMRTAVETSHEEWYKAWHWWAQINMSFYRHVADEASHAIAAARAARAARSAQRAAALQGGGAAVARASEDGVVLVGGVGDGAGREGGALEEMVVEAAGEGEEEAVRAREEEDAEAAYMPYIESAVHGYFRAVVQAQSVRGPAHQLQDLLRLITLWFRYEHREEVTSRLRDCMEEINILTWIKVVPQLLARIHLGSQFSRDLITDLLTKVGCAHPNAVLFQIVVATGSPSHERKMRARDVLQRVHEVHPRLVTEAELVARELNRMAVLWPERWHEALEEASRLYFSEQNVEQMLTQLLPLHEELEALDASPDQTLQEKVFIQRYGPDLQAAHAKLRDFMVTQRGSELQEAWDVYYNVFRQIQKGNPSSLELQQCSTHLHHASSLDLAVPGTYVADASAEQVVHIAAFSPKLQVLSSKQRPRRLTITGSNLKEYQFLLKGREDLRQDERVMQLFGLFNTLLSRDRSTVGKDLTIGRFAVVPLTPKSGLIGWLLNTDTMHVLIRSYREAREIPVNLEHRRMQQLAGDVEERLPAINKVEVFLEAVDESAPHNKGDDLQRVQWLNSRGSETWLERRTAFTRSTAVMSMLGYVLGLGDRHPSNLLVDRYSGKLLHIDFGDCFETAMRREKFPEKWPFRLTRMMVKAMGPTGIEGNFRLTCEAVVALQRSERDSLLAMLEACVYDPLVNWKFPTDQEHQLGADSDTGQGGGGAAQWAGGQNPEGDRDGLRPGAPPGAANYRLMAGERHLVSMNVSQEEQDEVYKTALKVMKKLNAKLHGTESKVPESVQQQVARLIDEARAIENLCQAYVGWCPFW